MRFATAPAVGLICLSLGLAGCSTTSSSTTKTSWWPFGSKNKASSSSGLASGNAPSAPSFGTTASPAVSMPGSGYAATTPNYGSTQYPVTPYPPSTVPGAAAYTANAASGGYMPPSDPYGSAAAANPYAAQAQAANPYAAQAQAANPYAAQAQPANPYAAQAQPANPYVAANPYAATPASANAYPQANPYAAGTPADSGYNATGQPDATQYPGAPTGGAGTPYAYR